MAIAVVFATMLLLLKKLILSITDWTNLSAERTFFLFSENKFCFRFFRETQDLKVIFPRNTGSFFRETQDIIETFNRDFVFIIKTASGFFLVFVTIKNWFNKKLVQ